MPDVFISNNTKNPAPQKIKTPKGDASVSPSVPSKPVSFFTSYFTEPVGIQIEGMNADERVVLFIRWHFTKNLPWITASLVLALSPSVLLFPGVFSFISSVIPQRFIFILISFYYLIILGYIFLHFITWFYNVGVITTKRIVDIDFNDIMNKDVAITRIPDVIDVEFNQNGFIKSYLDYGDVLIQTEAEKENFEFKDVPHPAKITDTILDLIDESGGREEKRG